MSYPPPPWHTRGRAFVQPYVVDARALRLPPGFEAVSIAGRALGALAYVEYVPPSPLSYHELIWIPCMVRVRPAGARAVRGQYVEKMYVDSEPSRDAGRTEWALPKQLARFDVIEDGPFTHIAVDTEDGARLVLEARTRGPSISAPASTGTLQDAGDHVVKFRGRGTSQLASGSLTVVEASGTDGWTGFATARRLPVAGVALRAFQITMEAARRIDHAVH